MNDPRITQLENTTRDIRHLNKTLFEHLYGTYELLKQQKKPEYVCLAGLFHSVYDTGYFQHGSKYSRESLRQQIGDLAENLVYEFCRTKNRTNDLLYNSQNWDKEVYRDLLDIEIANMIEQNFYNDVVKLLEGIRKSL
jgi:hypothetical protein